MSGEKGTGRGSAELEVALKAALTASKAASDVLLGRFRSSDRELDTWMKSPGALVTDADIAADRAIAAALGAAGVAGDFVSEESTTKRGGQGLEWLIDPLCGTVPFSTGLDFWGVNIALRNAGVLELGVLALPAQGEQLSVIRGSGVRRNGEPWTASPPGTELSSVAVGLEIDGGDEWVRLLKGGLEWVAKVNHIYMFASASFPIAQVLLGRLAAMVIYGVTPVHLAAGCAIALEMGLRVTDAGGAPIDWATDDEHEVIVIAWPEVHAELTDVMRR